MDSHGNTNNIMDNSKNLEDLVFKTKSWDEEQDAVANSRKHKNKNNNKEIKIRNQNLRTNKRYPRQNSSLNSNDSPRNQENFNNDFSSDAIPAMEEMNMDANNVPRSYTKPYNVNNFHVVDYKFGKHDFVIDNSKMYGNTNSSYGKTFNLPPHVSV